MGQDMQVVYSTVMKIAIIIPANACKPNSACTFDLSNFLARNVLPVIQKCNTTVH